MPHFSDGPLRLLPAQRHRLEVEGTGESQRQKKIIEESQKLREIVFDFADGVGHALAEQPRRD